MKKLFNNRVYLSMILGVFITFVSFLGLFLTENQTYFTTVLIIDIIVDFLVTGFILLSDNKKSNSYKFKCIGLYLFITLFILILDVIMVSSTWDFSIYQNLMYITNVKFYLSVYAVFVLVMELLGIYGILKENSKKNAV